jgi:hypothetical protein
MILGQPVGWLSREPVYRPKVMLEFAEEVTEQKGRTRFIIQEESLAPTYRTSHLLYATYRLKELNTRKPCSVHYKSAGTTPVHYKSAGTTPVDTSFYTSITMPKAMTHVTLRFDNCVR